jgi:hypothetical protein
MKKMIMFVMVLAISVTALATIEDLDPPQWRRTQPAATLVYQFEEDGDYDGGTAEPSCLIGSDDFYLDAPDGSWADGVLTTEGDTFFSVAIPEGTGENITIQVQAIITSGSPGEAIVDLRGDGFVYLDEVVTLSPEVSPLGDDLYVFSGTMAYDPDAIWAGVSIIGGNNVFEGVIVDVLVHDGDAPHIGDRVSDCFGLSPITVDSNDLPVYEPFDPCEPGFPGGTPVVGPTEGQLLVSLTWQPGDPCYPAFNAIVTVDPNIEGDGPHEDFVFPASTADDGSVTLGFTDANWSDPQAVIVQAVKDLDREGDEDYFVELTVTIDIADPNFSNVVDQLSISVVDNDVPYVVLSTDLIEISESDPCTCVNLQIKLSHEPTHDVFVRLFMGGFAKDEGLFFLDPPLEPEGPDPNRLTFTVSGNPIWDPCTMTSDWDVEQTVTACPVDNNDLTEAWLEFVPGDIWIPVFSEDVRYLAPDLYPDGSFADDPCTLDVEEESDGEAAEGHVSVLVQDNECGAVGFAGMDFNEDCAVGLADFANIYEQWLYCTEPYNVECDKLWILMPPAP